MTVERLRELLGPEADGKSDAELARINENLATFAGFVVRAYRGGARAPGHPSPSHVNAQGESS